MFVCRYRLTQLECRIPMVFVILFFLCVLSCLVPGTSASIAAGTETAHEGEVSHTHAEGMPCTGECLARAQFMEASWLGYGEDVSIATRYKIPISKAPGMITVITSEEIKNLGYRTFVELLRIVPGFEILKAGGYGSSFPVARGLHGADKIKILLNGHLVNAPADGAVFDRFDDFPLENIKRIEIIRGPGSALYGENALLAVINIITFDASDIDGAKITSGYGSFDTYEENAIFGKKLGKVELSGMAHYRQTAGFDGVIKTDSQTTLDKTYKTNASLAPGKVHDGRQEYDLNLKTVYKDFYVEGWYLNKHRGPFIGSRLALNDETDMETNSLFCEAGYKKTYEEVFTLKPRIYYDQFDDNSFLENYPEGVRLFVDTNGDGKRDTYYTYPDGQIASVIGIQRAVGTDIPIDYKVFDGNIVTVGVECRFINQSDTHFSSNYNPLTRKPLDSLQDFSDAYPFLAEATRRIWSVYMQDTWDITDTVGLTLGVRHDEYSDVGSTTNPRAGLTWAFIDNASLKLLYGKAFRPPSFFELYSTTFGNEDLSPTTIESYEVGVGYRFNKYVTSNINYFYNNVEDIISTVSNRNVTRYENSYNAHIQGFEMETKVDITQGNYVFMNYTFQNPEDSHGDDLPSTAQHFGNFGVNTHYWKYINSNVSTFVSGRRSRDAGDTRDDLPAYTLLNLSVIGKDFFSTMEVQGTVFNLLDKDYRDPASSSIPDDLPRPGRTFWVGLSYQF